MKFEVIWTRESEISLSEVIDYLRIKWYEKQILNFFEKLDSTIFKLKETPQIYPEFGPF